MQRFAKLFVASFFLLLLWSPDSFAVSFGAFVDGSRGSGEAEWENSFDSFDIDSKSGSFGFVLDTAPTDQRVFNYRLNVGLSRQETEDDTGVTLKSKGVYADNIFGFAFVRREDFRWWAGPSVRVGYYSGDTGSGSFSKTDIDFVEFGMGAVTGFNFKAGKAIISPSLGFRFNAFVGEGETNGQGKEDIEGDTGSLFVNLAVMF